MRNFTDEDLMREYQQGNGAAMEEIVRRYKIPVFRFTCRLCRNAAEAEDIAQEVFLRVHQYRHSYAPRGKFSTWIFGIAHHLFVSRLRKQRWVIPWPKKNVETDEPVEFASSEPSPQETAANNETAGILKQCIESLPLLQKEALILREFHQMNYQEIAGVLNQSLGTVKTLIHRARGALKDKMSAIIEGVQGGRHV